MLELRKCLFAFNTFFFGIALIIGHQIVDAFSATAASAIAAATFMRSIFAAAFPLFMVRNVSHRL